MLRGLAVIVLAVTVLACGTVSTKMNDINKGMTKGQVYDVLGEPESTSARKETELLIYQLRPQGSWFGKSEYWVMLEAGQVSQFGRPADW